MVLKNKRTNSTIQWGIFLVLTSIVMGAFGAHYFSEILSTDRMKSLQTGINYQMYMGLGMLMLDGIREKFSEKNWKKGVLMIRNGCLLFSFSIYGLVYLGHHSIEVGKNILGPLTPAGGAVMILGWTWLFIDMIKKK